MLRESRAIVDDPQLQKIIVPPQVNPDVPERLVAARMIFIADPQGILVELNSLAYRVAEDGATEPAVPEWIHML